MPSESLTAPPAVAPAYPWAILVRASLRLWHLKTVGTTAFVWLFFLAYLDLLRHPGSLPTVMPITAPDRWIGFAPWALPLYASLWVYVSLPTVLLFTVKELLAFGASAASVCLAGLACFYLWPTAVPPAAVDWAAHPGFALLKSLDAAGNACPSLHVATAVLAAGWLQILLRRVAARRWLSWASWLWCAGIVYSTMATRQHVFVDVAAGTALGALGIRLSLTRLCLAPFFGRMPGAVDTP